MAKSQDSYNKKEVRNKKEKKRKEKEKKRIERKANSKEGKSLDDMLAYVDENGNITSTPPDPSNKTKINAEDIEVSIPKREARDAESNLRKGIVTFFNDSKGYGFIKEKDNPKNVFVHINDLVDEDIHENSKVVFETEKGVRGVKAINVRLDK
jgi:cold shock CspA family protein